MYEYEQPPPPRSGMRVLKVVGLIMLVLVLICGGAVTYIAWNAKSWMASFARGPLIQEIQKSSLPEEQKAGITHNINRLSHAFEEGRLSWTQLGEAMAMLTEGSFVDLMLIETVRARYNAQSSAGEDQKQAAMLVFDRFQRGIVEERITQKDLSEAMTLVTNTRQGQRELKEQLTDTELNAFVEAMREKADAAGIPQEPYQVDFAARIEQVTVDILGEEPGASTQPAEAPPPAEAPLPAEAPPAESSDYSP